MKILIDLQSCQTASRYRGIGRYSIQLAEYMIKCRKEYSYFILVNETFDESISYIREKFEPIIGKKNIISFNSISQTAENNIEKSSVELSRKVREIAINEIKPDVVHITTFFEGFYDDSVSWIDKNRDYNVVVTQYDLIPIIYKNQYLKSKNIFDWYSRKLENLKQADLLLSISESAKEETLKYLNIPENKIVNISSAMDKSAFCYDVDDLYLKEFLNGKDFILYTANLDDRKNIDGLIEAYSMLPINIREANKLVIVVSGDENKLIKLKNLAKKFGIDNSSYCFTGLIDDHALSTLYKNCKLYVFPSKHEGFGLPCLEAMSFGKPVIGSNCSSIPEVLGMKDALFDPYSPLSIMKLIEKSLIDKDFYEKLVENSKYRIKLFSWKKSAEIALSAIEKLPKKIKKENTLQLNIKSLSQSIIKRQFPEQKIVELAYSIDSALLKTEKYIYVDVTVLNRVNDKTGIQRVVRCLLDVFIKLENYESYKIVPVYLDKNKYRVCVDSLIKWYGKTNFISEVINPSKNDIYLGLDLILGDECIAEPILLLWRNRGVKICFVIYDLLPIELPDFFDVAVVEAFERWLRLVLSIADQTLSISDTVSNKFKDLATRRKLMSHESFTLGSDFSDYEVDYTSLNSKYKDINLSKTFLAVGTLEPRKGYEALVNEFEGLAKLNLEYKLIIVGKPGWKTSKLQERLKSKNVSNVVWLNKCSDEELAYLYERCCCLIMSSYGEGFGLPIIEAAKYSLPLILRDIDIFREVAGDSAEYFSSDNEIGICISNWIQCFEKNSHKKSMKIKSVTWENSAIDLLQKITS
ncbi:TPA: glycosyltransferase family 4 protein [Vibrio cholerae]|nr:glycosyltransferase family 4 protein [Vibrio cholerae]